MRVLGSEQNGCRKIFNREALRLCGVLDILKLIKKSIDLYNIVLYFNLCGLVASLFWGDKPKKAIPW